MSESADNPFQSPEGMETEADGEEILIGTTIERGHQHVAASCIVVALLMGIWLLFSALTSDFDESDLSVAVTMAVFIAGAVVVYFWTLHSSKYALLSANRQRIRGRFSVNGRFAEAEVFWKDIVSCELDEQGNAYFDTNDGKTYAIHIGGYPQSEQQLLLEYCQKRLAEPPSPTHEKE